MTQSLFRRTATLIGPRRCVYCGHRCHGRTCREHEDLGSGFCAAGMRPFIPPLDPHAHAARLPTMRDELREAVKRP